jgi:hypothetical protein
MQANAIEIAVGGKGTIALGANQSIDNAVISAIYVREDAPNLQIFRERAPGEVVDTDVTAAHFVGTTPKAGDLILGNGYNFKRIVVGNAGSVTGIRATL